MNVNLNPEMRLQTEHPSSVKPTPAEAQENFANKLKGAIEQLNEMQVESDRMTNQLATGQVDDLHQVMITAQKASITLEATIQMQQRAIDAYNEIMRMQI
jgi:flagellar hook-basal body complex protein FliE